MWQRSDTQTRANVFTEELGDCRLLIQKHEKMQSVGVVCTICIETM